MRTAIAPLSLLEPRTLKEALVMLRDDGPLVPLAGCTDVYVNLNFGTSKDTRFLNLWPLVDLRRIEIRDGLLSIGALATYTQMIRSPLVRKRLPILGAASREIGGVQIQNRGALGGHIAHASPGSGFLSAARGRGRSAGSRSRTAGRSGEISPTPPPRGIRCLFWPRPKPCSF